MFHGISLQKMSFLLGIEITENTDLIKFILSKIQEIDNIYKLNIQIFLISKFCP